MSELDHIDGFTKKQISILKVIMAGNSDGSFVDLDQLLEKIDYKTTKQSMQFSIRSLISRGYIVRSSDTEIRRRRSRRLLIPNPKAFLDYESYVGKIS